MKWNFTFWILVFCFQWGYSQDTWNTKIPYESADALSPVKQLIKTNDNGFLVLIKKATQDSMVITKEYILKYNSLGELEWEREYDFGEAVVYGDGASPSRVLQLNNGDFIIPGIFKKDGALNCYTHKVSNQSDSLFFTMSSFGTSNCILPRFYINFNLYATYTDVNSGITFLATLDEDFFSIVDEVSLGEIAGSNSILNEDLKFTLVRSSFSFPFQDTIRNFSPSGNLMYEEIYEDKEIGIHLGFSQQGNLTAYENALIQLNEDLTQKWKVEKEDLLFVPTNTSLIQTSTALLPTSDNGFILAGRFGSSSAPLSLEQIYLIKVDEFGQWEWGYVYDSFEMPFNHIADIVEVSDGYVFVGTSEATQEIWIVKINKNGTTAIENIQEQIFPSIQVFPNPVSDFVNINTSTNAEFEITVFSTVGKIMSSNIFYRNIELDTNKLEEGIYFLKITNKKSKESIQKKIVVQ